MTTADEWSLNAVVKKHPNVSAANTVSVNANMVLALAKKVFIFRLFDQVKYKHQHSYQQSTFDTLIDHFRQFMLRRIYIGRLFIVIRAVPIDIFNTRLLHSIHEKTSP